MPPSPELGSVVAEWVPSRLSSVVWLAASGICGVVDVALVALHASTFLVAMLPLTALALLAWVEVRRSYLAIGDGWVYVRTRLDGGRWTFRSRLESAKITGKGGTTMLLRGPSFRGRVPVRAALMRRPTDFHRELARQLLAQRIELSDQARLVLQAWSGVLCASADDD
jgi:hypothetical protein